MNATPDQSPTDPTDPTGQPPGEPPEGGSRNPWIIGGAVVGIAVLAVVLFLVLRPNDDSTSAVQTGAAESPTVTTTTQETTTEVTTTVETTTETAPTTTAPDANPQRVELEVQDGQPVGGIKQVDITQGTLVLLVVRCDSEDQVHVHGYDLEAAVGPGAPARIQFRANIAGGFEVELHDLDIQIAELTVSP
jgi:hypothetical protein